LKRYVIIVAGGHGLRMGTSVPKQFLLLNNKTVLEQTIDAFLKAYSDIKIIIVLPENHIETWLQIYNDKNLSFKQIIVKGGITRYHSVKNGLSVINSSDALVAVHDGVRPLVGVETIIKCFEEAEANGAAIPVVPLKDSLRILKGDSSESINRENFRIVQTPQCFCVSILKKAYDMECRADFTDDASVVEAAGFSIALVEGTDDNIKITTKTDLAVANLLLLEKINKDES